MAKELVSFDKKHINGIPFKHGGCVYVFEEDYWGLYKYCQGMNDYIEIGSRFGASAIIAGLAVNGEVHCIEPFGVKGNPHTKAGGSFVSEKNLRENWELFHDPDRLVVHAQYHPPMPESIKGRRFDIGFVDGNHDYENVLADLAGMAEIVDKYILAHDIYDGDKRERSVGGAYKEFLKTNQEWEHIEYVGCVGVLKRRDYIDGI